MGVACPQKLVSTKNFYVYGKWLNCLHKIKKWLQMLNRSKAKSRTNHSKNLKAMFHSLCLNFMIRGSSVSSLRSMPLTWPFFLLEPCFAFFFFNVATLSSSSLDVRVLWGVYIQETYTQPSPLVVNDSVKLFQALLCNSWTEFWQDTITAKPYIWS